MTQSERVMDASLVDVIGDERGDRERCFALAGLDVPLVAAQGDYVDWQPARGAPRRALDLTSGAAGLLLGHNHPELVSVALRHFHERKPVLVGTPSGAAETLKRRLADRLARETQRDYVVLLLSTARDAMDVALTHARLELVERQRAARAAWLRGLRQLKQRLLQTGLALPEAFLRDSAALLGARRLAGLDDLARALLAHNAGPLDDPGHVLALDRGVACKVDGLPVSAEVDARWATRRAHGAVRTLRPGEALPGLGEALLRTLYVLELDPLAVRTTSFSTTAAVLFQPLGGEAGAFELEGVAIEQLRDYRMEHPEVPLIADETECGLGRTGRFLESAARGLPADYVIVGSALGGGVAKLAAVAIDRQRFAPQSNALGAAFAEDEFSCVVGSVCLATLERDRVCERSADLGAALGARLCALAEAFPGQVAEVRGRGLLLGLEWREQSANSSTVIRALDQDRALTSVIAGFLLHEHGVRLLPAAGLSRCLRLEPSAYLDTKEIERVGQALSAVCGVIEAGDAFALLHWLVRSDARAATVDLPPRSGRAVLRATAVRRGARPHVQRELAASSDPSLLRFRAAELDSLRERL